MSIEQLHQQYEHTTPTQNPLTYRFNRDYKHASQGKGGKLYVRRGRMLHKWLGRERNPHFAVPMNYECPLGFSGTGSEGCWMTKSEILAIRHYRKHGLAQNKLKMKFDRIIEKQEELFNLSKAVDCDVELPSGIKEGFIPRPHQKVGILFGKLTNGCFLQASQMRTGKSYTTLLYILSEEWNKCLIVAPAKVVAIWARMIETICDRKYKILRTGDTLESGFNLVSYDILHTIEDLSCDIAVGDEAHFFVTDDARRSNAIKRIKADKRCALSGTMVLNSVTDILGILEWVNPTLEKEMRHFVSALTNMTSFEQASVLASELRRYCMLLIDSYQIGNAPEPSITFIPIDVKIDNPKSLSEVGKAKVDYSIEYLKSFKEQILVVFHYRETGKMLKARLGNNALLINGETPKAEVEQSLKAFERGEVQYLVASSVIGEGVDLSYISSILVIEEASHSMRILQTRARASNPFKERQVNIDVIIAPNTQDDRLYSILNEKINLQNGFKSEFSS